MLKSSFSNKSLDVCVVSYGGVGCSSLMRVLSGYIRVNNVDDKDGLKHRNSPSLDVYSKAQIRRVIYIYNNPMNSVLSLYRRHYQRAQYKKLTGMIATDDVMTLENYIASGQDLFQLESHFHNWSAGSEKFPILMVNGATMYQPKNLQKLLRFLGVKIPLILFQQKPRKSNYKTVSPQIRLGLETIYHSFNDELSKLDDVYLIKKL